MQKIIGNTVLAIYSSTHAPSFQATFPLGPNCHIMISIIYFLLINIATHACKYVAITCNCMLLHFNCYSLFTANNFLYYYTSYICMYIHTYVLEKLTCHAKLKIKIQFNTVMLYITS